MNLQQRIEILEKLGKYILSDHADWVAVKENAARENNWFIPEFIELSTNNIAKAFLTQDSLQSLADKYEIPAVTYSHYEHRYCNGRKYPSCWFS